MLLTARAVHSHPVSLSQGIKCFACGQIIFRESEPVVGASQGTAGKGHLSSPLNKGGTGLSIPDVFYLIVSKSLYQTVPQAPARSS